MGREPLKRVLRLSTIRELGPASFGTPKKSPFSPRTKKTDCPRVAAAHDAPLLDAPLAQPMLAVQIERQGLLVEPEQLTDDGLPRLGFRVQEMSGLLKRWTLEDRVEHLRGPDDEHEQGGDGHGNT